MICGHSGPNTTSVIFLSSNNKNDYFLGRWVRKVEISINQKKEMYPFVYFLGVYFLFERERGLWHNFKKLLSFPEVHNNFSNNPKD